jgi:hypothetical protein
VRSRPPDPLRQPIEAMQAKMLSLPSMLCDGGGLAGSFCDIPGKCPPRGDPATGRAAHPAGRRRGRADRRGGLAQAGAQPVRCRRPPGGRGRGRPARRLRRPRVSAAGPLRRPAGPRASQRNRRAASAPRARDERTAGAGAVMPQYDADYVRICVLIVAWTCSGHRGGAIRWHASTATRGRPGGSSSGGCRASAPRHKLSGSTARGAWWCTARRRAAARPGTSRGMSRATADMNARQRPSKRAVSPGGQA